METSGKESPGICPVPGGGLWQADFRRSPALERLVRCACSRTRTASVPLSLPVAAWVTTHPRSQAVASGRRTFRGLRGWNAVLPGRRPAGAGCAREGSRGPGGGWSGDSQARAPQPLDWVGEAGQVAAAAKKRRGSGPIVCCALSCEVLGGTLA